MAWNLNKQPLNFEPMVALSADVRRKYGKEPDGCKVPDAYKWLLGDSIPPGADLWRNYNGVLDAIESIAAEAANDPRLLAEVATMEWHIVRDQRRLLRRYIRARFGIRVTPAFCRSGEKGLSFPPVRVVDRERARSRTLLEEAYKRDLLNRYLVFETLWWAINYAMREAFLSRLAGEVVASYWTMKYSMWGIPCKVVLADSQRGSAAEAAISAFLCVMRSAPICLAAYAAQREGPPGEKRFQEAATGSLSAWVRSQTKMYPDLEAALAEEGDPHEVLFQELPGAIAAELDELGKPGTLSAELEKLAGHGVRYPDLHKVLTNRVTNRLRMSGSAQKREARKRAQKGEYEIPSGRLGASRRREQEEGFLPSRKPPPPADVDIEDFELRETMRQQLDQLRSWVEKANFSEREAQVYELDTQTNRNTTAIAHELGIPAKKVRDYRSRYVAKIRKAAGL